MAEKKRIVMKKMSFVFLGAMAALTMVVSSCVSFQASGLQMGLDQSSSNYETLGDFSDRVWVNKFLGTSGGTTFLNLSSEATDPAVRNTIEKHIKRLGGDAAINIRIRYGSGPLTYILNSLTLGIWSPSTITVTGTVVKDK
jgi:hypothetical protein